MPLEGGKRFWNKGADAGVFLQKYQNQLDDIENRLTEANRAASKAAGTEDYDRLMAIRDKLVARGGDTRALIQKIYQKDKEGSLVNKLIYKYKAGNEQALFELYEFYKPLFLSSINVLLFIL